MHFTSGALLPSSRFGLSAYVALEPTDASDDQFFGFELAGNVIASSPTPPATEEAETEREGNK